jgi:hypothetical protein
MIVSVKLENNDVVDGFVWLIAPDRINRLPIGTRYAIMSDDPNYFEGKLAIVTDNTNSLFEFGAENSNNLYPNGQKIYEYGNILTWVTVEEQILIDPFPEATDNEIFISAKLRAIIPADAVPVGNKAIEKVEAITKKV